MNHRLGLTVVYILILSFVFVGIHYARANEKGVDQEVCSLENLGDPSTYEIVSTRPTPVMNQKSFWWVHMNPIDLDIPGLHSDYYQTQGDSVFFRSYWEGIDEYSIQGHNPFLVIWETSFSSTDFVRGVGDTVFFMQCGSEWASFEETTKELENSIRLLLEENDLEPTDFLNYLDLSGYPQP